MRPASQWVVTGYRSVRTVVHDQRCMIGKPGVFVDRGSQHPVLQTWRDNLIVDAPTDILCTRLSAVGPPGVLVRLLVYLPERIHETDFIEQGIEPGTLFR